MDLKRVLTIAGSDSSGGAGIQADLKTIAAHLLYGESALTALTAQNTLGVTAVHDVPPAFVAAQIDAVFADIRPDAVKVGMVSTADNMRVVAARLSALNARNVVVDPVMVATSGADLMRSDALRALVDDLLSVADVLTPNIPEASVLAGFDAGEGGVASMVAAARAIARLTPAAVLVKGGHLAERAGEGESAQSVDVLLLPGADEPVLLAAPRIATANTHGTGCTLSSAIACNLACGLPVEEAVRAAKAYLGRCLVAGLDLGAGPGPLDHMAGLRARAALRAPVSGRGEKPATPRCTPPEPVPACTSPGCGAPAEGDAEQGALSLDARRVLIVGGSPERPAPDLLDRLARDCDLVVACDAGADACAAAGVGVDVLVGDDDSVTPAGLAHARATMRHELLAPMDKDDVDLGLAVSWARTHCPGLAGLVFTGVSGGRVDHALAVLGIAARAADLAPAIEEDAFAARVLAADGAHTWELGPDDLGRTLSVVALLGDAVVSERGMRWDVDHARLAALDDLGVSNVVQGAPARVTVHEGTVLVTLQRERIKKEVTQG